MIENRDLQSDSETLRATMKSKAGTEGAEIREEYARQIAAVKEMTEADIRSRRDSARTALDYEIRQYRARLMSEALVELRAKKLAIKQGLLDAAFDKAGGLLTGSGAAEGKRVRDALKHLSTEALKYAGAGAAIGKAAGPDAGAVIAESADGLRLVDNGLKSRLTRARRQLLPELSAVLFPSAPANADDSAKKEG